KDQSKPPFDYSQFGGTLGGPLVREKTFYFADFQGTKSKRSDTLTLSVPTDRMRAGDFSEEGNPIIIDPTTGQPFDGNVIPQSRISALAQAFINLYPSPNRPGLRNNYVVSPTVTQDTYQGDLRLDQYFTQSDAAFLRGSYIRQTRFIPAPLPGIAGGGDYGTGDTTRKTWGGVLGYSKTLSDHSFNEFRGGFNHLSTDVGVPAGGTFVPPASLQVPGVTLDNRVNGLAAFAPDSYAFIGDPEFNPTYTLSQEMQFSDTLTFLLGRHTLRGGAVVRQSRFNLFQIPQPRGKFTFSGEFTTDQNSEDPSGDPLADAFLGLASQTDIQNITDVKNRTWYYAAFLQDDFQITDHLTVNAGLRYEYTEPTVETRDRQSNLDFATGQLRVAGENGNSRGLIDVDRNDLAPRLGFAWRPGGSEDWVVRGGVGRFYNHEEPRTAFQLGFNPPFFFSVSRFSDFGVTPAAHVDEGFPPVSPEDAEFPILITVDRRFRSPYYDQWNLSVQRSLPWDASIEVGYVGTRGHRLQVLRDLNQPAPAAGDVQERRPYPQYGNFASIRNDGRARYDGAQVKISKRSTHGFWLLASYTYGKAKSDQGEIGLASPWPQNSLDVASDYGRSDGDQTHRFVGSFTWDLPFGQGKRFLNKTGVLDTVLGGWQLGGIYTYGSGFPFTPLISGDPSNTGTFGSVRPDKVGDPSVSHQSPNGWFDPNAYAAPAPYTFGNAKRNSLEGPDYSNLDLYLAKRFGIGKDLSIEIRLEAYNLFNHPNFGQPDPFIDSDSGGTITSLAGPMRELQWGLRLYF
ncbi:MAG: TonB-dependent receptor, partial [Acidobacteriota bacterium]